jgi:hypothetical protein
MYHEYVINVKKAISIVLKLVTRAQLALDPYIRVSHTGLPPHVLHAIGEVVPK